MDLEVATGRSAHPNDVPRVNDLPLGNGDVGHDFLILRGAGREDPVRVRHPTDEIPAAADAVAALDLGRGTERAGRARNPHSSIGALHRADDVLRQPTKDGADGRGDHRDPTDRPVGLGKLLDDSERRQRVRLLAAVAPRGKEHEEVGGGHCIGEIRRDLPQLFDLVRQREDPRDEHPGSIHELFVHFIEFGSPHAKRSYID